MSERTRKIVAAAERLRLADVAYRKTARSEFGYTRAQSVEMVAARRELFEAVAMPEETAAFEAEYTPGMVPGEIDEADFKDGIVRACKLAEAGGRSFVVSVRAEVREVSCAIDWIPQFPDRLRVLLQFEDAELGALAWGERSWASNSPLALMKRTQRLGLPPDIEFLRRDALKYQENAPEHLATMKKIGERLRVTIEELAPKACGTCSRHNKITKTLNTIYSNCGGEG